MQAISDFEKGFYEAAQSWPKREHPPARPGVKLVGDVDKERREAWMRLHETSVKTARKEGAHNAIVFVKSLLAPFSKTEQ